MNPGKRTVVEFFISYAREDDKYASSFMREFREMSAPSLKYEYRFWQDTEILPGESWEKEISAALKNCTLGLLLVSPAFLASPFIDEVELSHFIGNKAKPVVPVMLKMVNLKRHNLKGLDARQIFRFRTEGSGKLRSFAQCGITQQTDFVFELFDRVEARLDRLYG